jgi:hypothetical protein
MNPKYKKDYFAGITTALSKARHTVVKEIANRLCAVRDELTSDKTPCVETRFWFAYQQYKTFWVTFPMSNSAIYEAVNAMLPRTFKDNLYILDVLAGAIKGKRNRVYEYSC